MRKAFYSVFLVLVFSLVIACSANRIQGYENQEPRITVEGFFNGDLVAYGIVRNRSGKAIRTFEAVLKGQFVDGEGTLDEVFWFGDGERQTRLWKMTKTGDNLYTGTAGDVVGSARIESRGNAINLGYQLLIPYKEGEIKVSMDDWMYQVIPGVVINETVMYKWGFEVGKVTLVIMKAELADKIPALVERFDQ